jgi:ligand-binding sensor domain-containing protein
LASVDVASGEVTVYAFRNGGLAPNASSGVMSIQEDRDRALWLGTDKLGLVKLMPDRTEAIWYQSNPDDPDGLRGDLVVGLYKDRDGSFWSTTKSGAVYRFDTERARFRSYRHQQASTQSLGRGSVTAAYADDPDTLWIGTDRGLNRVDRTTDQVTQVDQPSFVRGVSAIAKDRSGNLWFGTRYGGLCRYDGKTFTAFARNALKGDNVFTLYEDTAGIIWIGVSAIGLCSYDGTTFICYDERNGNGIRVIMSTLEDVNGQLWFGTGAGVYRFTGGTFTNWTKKDALRPD